MGAHYKMDKVFLIIANLSVKDNVIVILLTRVGSGFLYNEQAGVKAFSRLATNVRC